MRQQRHRPRYEHTDGGALLLERASAACAASARLPGMNTSTPTPELARDAAAAECSMCMRSIASDALSNDTRMLTKPWRGLQHAIPLQEQHIPCEITEWPKAFLSAQKKQALKKAFKWRGCSRAH